MSLQEKLTAKNKAHSEAKGKEYRRYHLIFVIGTPIFLAIYYEIITLLNTDSQLQNALFAVFFSVTGLGAIAVFTLRQFTNHLLRLLILVVSNVWLCFFWVWSDGNIVGLMPPAILYLANRIIRS
jgi:predicted neutral ceramidase superfamily lipid hydrolase